MSCCAQRSITWGLYGSPRQWATVYCAGCRHVYRWRVPAVQAKLVRNEIEEELCKRIG
jgi:hypothetical protein